MNEEALASQLQRSAQAWRLLGTRVRTITPSQLVRTAMVSAGLLALGWLVASAWQELLPFQLGLVLAYITLPVVNALDRIMPRWLAASLMVVIEIVALVLLVAVLVPPIVQEVGALVGALPDLTELQDRVAQVRERLSALPESTQVAVRSGIDRVVDNVRSNVFLYLQSIVAVVVPSILGLFNTLGFVIGFFAIPTWLVAVLTDQKTGVRAIKGMLPAGMQSDFWAIMRILDRTFGAFVRGQVVVAIAVGVSTYIGLELLGRVATAAVPYPVVLAVIAGVLQLIPNIGPILSTLLAGALSLTIAPRAALAVVALYVLIQLLQSRLLAARFEERYTKIHPTAFVVLLVLLSQFGFFWVLVAAPLSTVARDLFRYVYGRFGDPPSPAGVLPDEPVPVPVPLRSRRLAARAVPRAVMHG